MENVNEPTVKENVRVRLAPYFYIYDEQDGMHWSGRKLTIDWVIKPRDQSDWASKDIMFGVEFKGSGENFGKTTRHLAQCVSYTETRFDIASGRLIPILSCPPCVPDYLDCKTTEWVKRFIGQLNVGQVSWDNRLKLCIEHTGHIIWSERNGVQEGRRWSLRKRVGSGR